MVKIALALGLQLEQPASLNRQKKSVKRRFATKRVNWRDESQKTQVFQ